MQQVITVLNEQFSWKNFILILADRKQNELHARKEKRQLTNMMVFVDNLIDLFVSFACTDSFDRANQE